MTSRTTRSRKCNLVPSQETNEDEETEREGRMKKPRAVKSRKRPIRDISSEEPEETAREAKLSDDEFVRLKNFLITLAEDEDKRTCYTPQYRDMRKRLSAYLQHYEHGRNGTLPQEWSRALEYSRMVVSDEYSHFLELKKVYEVVEPVNLKDWFTKTLTPIQPDEEKTKPLEVAKRLDKRRKK